MASLTKALFCLEHLAEMAVIAPRSPAPMGHSLTRGGEHITCTYIYISPARANYRLGRTMAPPTTPTIDALLHTLSRAHGLHARPSVLRVLLTNLLAGSAHPPPSGPGLIQSLRFRLLASDITVSLQPYANLCLPPVLPNHAPAHMVLSAPVSAAAAAAAATATPAATSSSSSASASDGAHVAAGIVVQVLDVVDLSSSRGDALDRLEMAARGEAMRGREVIRLVPSDDNASPIDGGDEGGGAGGGGRPGTGAAAAFVGGRDGARGMHRLLLEDAAGRHVWAFELTAVPGIRVGMNIGAKILLRAGCEVARGVVLLTADTATVLGGKVDALHKAWTDSRKATLQAEIDRLRSAP